MITSPLIDLNCDLGEGALHDEELLRLITSANVACGAHAGDDETMARLASASATLGISLGAHPGYADRAGQGRRIQKMDTAELVALVAAQIRRLQKFGTVRHVKPHGALYNQAASDPAIAEAIVAAVGAVDRTLILYGSSGGELLRVAKSAGLQVASEVFADRTYQPNGLLTPRSQSDAMVVGVDDAVAQVLQMAGEGTVRATNGSTIPVIAETICLHGDEPHAVEFAQRVRAALVESGFVLRAPAR